MLDIRISDPEPVGKDPFSEALTVYFDGAASVHSRTIIVSRHQPQGARALQLGMVIAEALQDATAQGVRL